MKHSRPFVFAVIALLGIAAVAARMQTSAVEDPGTTGKGRRGQSDPEARGPAPSVDVAPDRGRVSPRGTTGVRTSKSGQPGGPQLATVIIPNVPHIRQKPDFCGEACAAMYLQALGQPMDQDYVFDQSGLDPLQARGCYTKELAAALKNIGFRVGLVWHKVAVKTAEASLDVLWRQLYADLASGVPSIVCTRYDGRPNTTEHFRLILGYDAEADEVAYHDPAETGGAYRRMKRTTFLSLWPLKYSPTQWTVIRMRLEPGRMARGETASTFTSSDYAQHLMKLKPKIPGEGFTVLIQHPFVVIGDESPASVKQRAVSTVQWAVDRLKKAYFQKDPTEILDIWLFQDKTSYEKHTQAIFGHRPTTPFGYFSDTDRALVMNIATGGGTLVHEIVHPFMAANFPKCPAWLNEGLGSLYEQCGHVDGRIEGFTNWRLAGLQEAIRKKQVPSFKTLCFTTSHQFYHEDRGTNYAQARYLCYYLEQNRLLRKFYHRFRANHENDPTGYDTLKEILGRDDVQAFQKEWEAYVLKLRFP
ncbi:MAG: C39 family peptidase [Planctomycetota bacterium]|jgi:hypothetical protein